jgi:hypothetical protein
MKVLIATPVAGNSCVAVYAGSMFALAAHAARRGDIEMAPPRFFSTSLVAQTRSAFASLVLQDASVSHLLFVDSDIGFRPDAVTRMLDSGKPIVGCICPGRVRDPQRAFQAARLARTPAEADLLAIEFITSRELIASPQGLVVENGFARTRGIGCGLTLIHRSVLERLRDAYPELLVAAYGGYLDHGVREQAFQCFQPLQEEDGRYLSEDLSFCRRWTAIGGEVWALLDEPITHAGFAAPQGRFLDQLRLQAELTRP